MTPSSSPERHPAPNSVSANRRSISCCTHAMASSAVAQGETALADWPKLALTVIRLGACTTAGAQITEVNPERNRRRERTSELVDRTSFAFTAAHKPVVPNRAATGIANSRVSSLESSLGGSYQLAPPPRLVDHQIGGADATLFGDAGRLSGRSAGA